MHIERRHLLPTQHARPAGRHAWCARARCLSVRPFSPQQGSRSRPIIIASLILTLHEGETGVIIITNLRSIVSFAVASPFYWGFAPNEKSKWNK